MIEAMDPNELAQRIDRAAQNGKHLSPDQAIDAIKRDPKVILALHVFSTVPPAEPCKECGEFHGLDIRNIAQGIGFLSAIIDAMLHVAIADAPKTTTYVVNLTELLSGTIQPGEFTIPDKLPESL